MLKNFFFENHVFLDNVENIVEPGRLTQIACWIPKAANSPSEYVILTDFPQQQWLHECTSMLHLYVHCLSF
jgi:hypothetical protein